MNWIFRLLVSVLVLPALLSAQGASLPLFAHPFSGDYPLGNWHDHQSPKEFIDADGVIINSEGQTCRSYIDGHEGYDWSMPEGTPLYAVADGEINYSGLSTPASCPILNIITSANIVVLAVTSPENTFFVNYVHLSQSLVKEGQKVTKGELIGYSGNTGCSTLPHLHFAVYIKNSSGNFSPMDPYGWNANTSDPWLSNPEGVASTYLWDAEAAPSRYFDDSFAANNCKGCNSPVAITRVRWMGPNDSLEPNNEFVELSIDPRFGPNKVNFDGWTLKNNAGKSFKLKTSSTSSSKSALRIFSGKGKPNKKQIFLSQKAGIWSDSGDCVRLFNKKRSIIYYFIVGNASCPVPKLYQNRS